MGCSSPGDTEGWCSAGDLLHAMLGSWDPPRARHYHAGSGSGGCPKLPSTALSTAALYILLENREEGGGCEDTSPLPSKPPMDKYPHSGGTKGWPEGTHGSRECP